MEQKKEKQMPANSITIKVGPNEYNIKYPNNGKLIDIERMKIKLTDGTHKDMLFGTNAAQHAYLLTESIATFMILIPELTKDLTVPSLMDLNPMQTKSIVDAYSRVYYPWMEQWRAIVNEEVEEEEKK